jgi:Uma2 family endonuclease
MDATVTAEEATRLDPSGLWELVEGRIIPLSPAGARHGRIVVRVSHVLHAFVEARQLGAVLAGDVGFILRRKPDTVRGPDVAFLRAARWPTPAPAEFIDGPPDLAIEILSPDDRLGAVSKKVREYLAAGAIAVWVIDPGAETATSYSAAGTVALGREASLTCPELLGDFALPLAALW